jgi:hypothetical protein
MGFLAGLLDVSLEVANRLYTWGWVFSVVGAAVTLVGIAMLSIGTRVRDHDSEMQVASLNLEAGNARERAAKLEQDAARLRFELDREIQKRAPRFLTEEQKETMLAELRGKILEVAVVVQNDVEAEAFALQFFIIFQDAGAKVYKPEPPREDKWFAPAGLMMYSPLGANEDQLKDDPLYRALKRANLFGGTAARPFVSGRPRGPTPASIQDTMVMFYILAKSHHTKVGGCATVATPEGFPGRPMTLLISCRVAFPCGLNDEKTSHRSTASSLYRWK